MSSFLIPTTPTQCFSPGGFSEVNRLLNRPAVKRMYYGILEEMVVGPDRWFHSSHLGPYMEKPDRDRDGEHGHRAPGRVHRPAGGPPRERGFGPWCTRRSAFAITTRGGANFATTNLVEDFAGSTPVEVARVLVVSNGEFIEALPAQFPTMTTWKVDDVLLVPGQNALEFLGYDLRGNLVDSDSITVTVNSDPWARPAISGLQPDTALAGETIEVLGTDFHDGVRVFFGSTEAAGVTYDESGVRPDRIVATVPAGTGAA